MSSNTSDYAFCFGQNTNVFSNSSWQLDENNTCGNTITYFLSSTEDSRVWAHYQNTAPLARLGWEKQMDFSSANDICCLRWSVTFGTHQTRFTRVIVFAANILCLLRLSGLKFLCFCIFSWMDLRSFQTKRGTVLGASGLTLEEHNLEMASNVMQRCGYVKMQARVII